MNLNADMTKSKIFLDSLLEGPLEKEIFLCQNFFKLPLKTCFREKFLRVLLHMLIVTVLILY
jgi:hypothetical protein